MSIADILANNARWAAEQTAGDPDFFRRLTGEQHPFMLYIGCSDSRVTAEEMMGLGPGEAFILRNIGNLAPALDPGATAVLTYAVAHLEVDHVVVCGHSLCVGIEAALQPKDLGPLNPWLRTIRDVYRTHAEELDAIADGETRMRRMVELNVVEQCSNVLKEAEEQRPFRERRLRVHGLVFDVSEGRIIDLEVDTDSEMETVSRIYSLD